MRIERVLLENLGPIGHAELALGAVTAIVGTSGSGKTTALRAIQALLRNNRTGGKVLLRAGPIVLDRVGDQSSLTEGHDFSMLPAPAYLQPSPWALRQAAALNDGPTYLDEQGGMLASAVTRIILGAPETHAAIQSDLGRIVPRFRAVRSLPDGLQFTLRFDFDNAKNVHQAEVSTGTLVSLALLVLVHAPATHGRPGLLALIDDPETALHPAAQVELINCLTAATSATDVQVLLATHSPFVVDAVGPQNVYVLGQGAEGRSEARPLSEHPDADRALRVLTAGEFWGSVGENWAATNT